MKCLWAGVCKLLLWLRGFWVIWWTSSERTPTPRYRRVGLVLNRTDLKKNTCSKRINNCAVLHGPVATALITLAADLRENKPPTQRASHAESLIPYFSSSFPPLRIVSACSRDGFSTDQAAFENLRTSLLVLSRRSHTVQLLVGGGVFGMYIWRLA